MFAVLKAEEIGTGLTERMAITPAAGVSGFYLARLDATYFNVGRIGGGETVRMGAAAAAAGYASAPSR